MWDSFLQKVASPLLNLAFDVENKNWVGRGTERHTRPVNVREIGQAKR